MDVYIDVARHLLYRCRAFFWFWLGWFALVGEADGNILAHFQEIIEFFVKVRLFFLNAPSSIYLKIDKHTLFLGRM